MSLFFFCIPLYVYLPYLSSSFLKQYFPYPLKYLIYLLYILLNISS